MRGRNCSCVYATSRISGGGGVRFLLLTLLVSLAALLVATSQSQAQSYTATEDLGALRSHQTITRTGLLSAASPCRFDGVQYYNYYVFELSGAGQVTATVTAADFREQIVFNTSSGEFLAGANEGRYSGHYGLTATLTRSLPAGQYQVLAISTGARDAGSYTLTIQTGRLVGSSPPPPPETTTDADQDDGQALSPDDTEDTEAVRGHVLARVHPLPENDRRGAYRVEFGFLSEEVLASGTDRTSVVQANAHLLPPSRYLNEALMLDRARDNNRNWLHSSPVDVRPLGGGAAALSGEPLLTGRVIARWNPTAEGRLRIEFGFLPEWAIEASSDNVQRAAEMYANLLPDPGRYLTQSRINSEARRNAPRWLTSSLAEIPTLPTGPSGCTGRPIAITPTVPLTLSRSEAISDESIAIIRGVLGETFAPVTVAGLPPGLEWELAETRSDGCEHQLTVSGTISASAAARDYRVQITAEGADGARTPVTLNTITIRGVQPPMVNSISCSPSSYPSNRWEPATCTASLSGGTPTEWAWSLCYPSGLAPRCTGSPDSARHTWHTEVGGESAAVASLEVRNEAGSHTNSFTFTVNPPEEPERLEPLNDEPDTTPQPPVIDSISCRPSHPEARDPVYCTAQLSGGALEAWEWSDSGGGAAGCSYAMCSENADSVERYTTTFNRQGLHTVSLTVRNSVDSATLVRLVDVQEDLPPTEEPVGVRPNQPPVSVPETIMHPMVVGVGYRSNEREISPYFRDDDGDPLTYVASSTSPSTVSASVQNGDELTVTGLRAGSVTIAVTADDGNGGTLTRRFTATAAPYPSRFVRCQPDTIRVYYLNPFAGTKHWLDMEWGEVAVRVPGWGEHMIGQLSQSACNIWHIGSIIDTSNWAGWVID